MPFQQPPRLPSDGAVAIRNLGDDRVAIVVTTNGEEQSIVCSPFNATRVFGMLAVMLHIPLPAALGKAIKLG